MAALILPSRWAQQPAGAEVRWNHPSASKLDACYVLDGLKCRNLGLDQTIGGLTLPEMGLASAGSGQRTYDTSTTSSIPFDTKDGGIWDEATTSHSFLFVGTVLTADNGGQGIFSVGGISQGAGVGYKIATGALTPFVRGVLGSDTASGFAVGETLACILTLDGAVQTLYTNKRDVVSMAESALSSHTGDPELGRSYSTSFAKRFGGVTHLYGVFRRALPKDEALGILENPWQLFRSAKRRIYFDVGAASGLTLVADSGSLSVAGNATAFQAGRLLAAGSASFALSGQAAGTNAGRVLSATSGAFVLTRQAAGLAACRALLADSAAFALSGNTAGLSITYTLSAAPASFTLTGNVAGVVASRVIAAGNGAFALTGNAATLTVSQPLYVASGYVDPGYVEGDSAATYTLTAAAGSFSIAGQAAGLLAARKLASASGSIALAGSAAGLAYGRSLTAASGGFAVSGATAGLAASRQLSAATGAIVLTGNPVIFGADSKVLAAGAGSFAASGGDAQLVVHRKFVADAGAVSLTGSASVFARGRRMAAGVGAFDLSGSAAGLQAARRLGLAAGSFALTGNDVRLHISTAEAIAGPLRRNSVFVRMDAPGGAVRIEPQTVFARIDTQSPRVRL